MAQVSGSTPRSAAREGGGDAGSGAERGHSPGVASTGWWVCGVWTGPWDSKHAAGPETRPSVLCHR